MSVKRVAGARRSHLICYFREEMLTVMVCVQNLSNQEAEVVDVSSLKSSSRRRSPARRRSWWNSVRVSRCPSWRDG